MIVTAQCDEKSPRLLTNNDYGLIGKLVYIEGGVLSQSLVEGKV